MKKYNTKQRKILISYLLEHLDEQLSAKQIVNALDNPEISISAVYRNLAELESEGKIRRVNVGHSREVFYQYTDVNDCRECMHLSCKQCGRTFHMPPVMAEFIAKNVEAQSEFVIDRNETQFYGICKTCRKESTV